MVEILRSSDAGCLATLMQRLGAREQTQGDVSGTVRGIIEQVRTGGDAALCELTARFDALSLTPNQLRFDEDAIAKAKKDCPEDIAAALAFAAARIRDYHERQMPSDHRYTDEGGTLLGWQWRALASAGLYVPGGRASYPSSVLMNAIAAQVAGVSRLVMVVPTPRGEVNPALLVAASLAGVHEIYRIGGAQAIAALAYGTQTIHAVDKIVGPGNAYVAEAKRQVFGRVGIDTIAGPSEICVVADKRNNPDWIAADLLSQAEHDPQAQSILICDDEAFAQAVQDAIARLLPTLPREAIARQSWNEQGIIVIVSDAEQSAEWINHIAPEHLELAIEAPEPLAAQVRHAGAIFLGRHTPEAIGDYVAGPSHVLPTTRASRFSSGLSVYDFLKKSSLIGCTPASVQPLAQQAAILADCEGLSAHALSLRLRLAD